MITPEQFDKKMKYIKEKFANDPKRQHAHMENLMCYILTQCGYGNGVKVFKEHMKEFKEHIKHIKELF